MRACMSARLVKGEGFAIDASVMEADADRYHGETPDEIDWSSPQPKAEAKEAGCRITVGEDMAYDIRGLDRICGRKRWCLSPAVRA